MNTDCVESRKVGVTANNEKQKTMDEQETQVTPEENAPVEETPAEEIPEVGTPAEETPAEPTEGV